MVEVLTHNQIYATPQDALAHYGVKGMKWGVRNEDRPSFSDRRQVRLNDKAASLRARAAKTDVRIQEIKAEQQRLPKSYNPYGKQAMLKNELNSSVGYRDRLNREAKKVESSGGHLTPNQKRVLIGAAVVGGIFAANYLASKSQSGELQSFAARGQAALRGKPFEFRRNSAFAKAKTPDQVLNLVAKGINPRYNTPGGQMNCRRCTMAYELRRRGYDVTATTSAMGYGQSETGLLNALSPGKRNLNRATSLSTQVASGRGIRAQAARDRRSAIGERSSIPDAAAPGALHALLRQQPDGARGEAVFNFGGFGHSLAYERFGDKTYIFDTQKGQRYDVGNESSYRSFLDKWGFFSVKDVQVTRLDNVPLDQKFLSRWATDKPAPAAPKPAPAPAPTPRPSRFTSQEIGLARTGERPANMHITTWNALQREAGLR